MTREERLVGQWWSEGSGEICFVVFISRLSVDCFRFISMEKRYREREYKFDYNSVVYKSRHFKAFLPVKARKLRRILEISWKCCCFHYYNWENTGLSAVGERKIGTSSYDF